MAATATEQFPTPESLDRLSEPHPFLAKLTADTRAAAAAGTLEPSPFHPDVVHLARAARMKMIDAIYTAPPAGVKESTRDIEMRDGFQSELRIHSPTEPPTGGSPLIVLVFGGGWCMGENRSNTPIARALVKLYSAVVVCISYRLAPEHPFPASINDGWDSYKWIAANAQSLGGDPSLGFILGGISAGANISAVIAAQAINHNISPPLTGLWLDVLPAFHDKSVVPDEYKPFYKSPEQNAIVPGLDGRAIHHVQEHLKFDKHSEWYQPTQIKGFPQPNHPKTYLEVCGMDPIRDDGIIYEKILRKAGIKTRLTVWPGCTHAHFAFFPTEEASRDSFRDMFKGFAWLLEKPEPTNETIDGSLKVYVAPN